MKFARALVTDPLAVGAVLPSSRVLARAITARLRPEVGGVLELGSGTGVFAQQLLARGFRTQQLVLVEQDPGLAAGLQAQFAGATVLRIPAQDLSLERSPSLHKIAATICGLPLKNMSEDVHRRLLAAVFDIMKHDGSMYLFTYGMSCPISPKVLDSLALSATLTDYIIRNLPPASIYRLSAKV